MNIFINLPEIKPTHNDIGKIAFLKSDSFPYVIYSTLMLFQNYIATYDKKHDIRIIAILDEKTAQPLINEIRKMKSARALAIANAKIDADYNIKQTLEQYLKLS